MSDQFIRGGQASSGPVVNPAQAGISAIDPQDPRLRGDDGINRELPRPLRPFVDFATTLRVNGFPVAPDQTIGFLQATGLLGPRDLNDVRRAAIALFAIPPERLEEFNALFNAVFLGAQLPAAIPDEEEPAEAHEPSGTTAEIDQADTDQDPGTEATALERLSHRPLADSPDQALARFRRLAPARLPRRRSYRFAPGKGRLLDMRRTLREAARRDGEVLDLATRRHKDRQRRVILLIDVSGSMQERTEESLRFGHSLAQVAERAEIFTLGTRLTRVTPALRARQQGQALVRAAGLVADIDGGTRIGDALRAFLDVPRYAGFARGAQIIVLSDGLERGTPEALIDAVERLARLAWRIDWLSPLAGDGFAPRTEALTAILPHLDALADGATPSAITAHVLNISQRNRHPRGGGDLSPSNRIPASAGMTRRRVNLTPSDLGLPL